MSDDDRRWASLLGFFAAVLALAVVVGVVLGALFSPACAQEAEWKKLQRVQAAEFCAIVKPPPPALIEAVKQSVEKDPKTWEPTAKWLSDLATEYKRRGCGHA